MRQECDSHFLSVCSVPALVLGTLPVTSLTQSGTTSSVKGGPWEQGP